MPWDPLLVVAEAPVVDFLLIRCPCYLFFASRFVHLGPPLGGLLYRNRPILFSDTGGSHKINHPKFVSCSSYLGWSSRTSKSVFGFSHHGDALNHGSHPNEIPLRMAYIYYIILYYIIIYIYIYPINPPCASKHGERWEVPERNNGRFQGTSHRTSWRIVNPNVCHVWVPGLVNVYKKLWKITIFNGKIHYKWWFIVDL